jgi:hypothetical protein
MSVLAWYLYPCVRVTISYIKIRSINEKVPLSSADKEKEQSLIDLHNQYVATDM